MGSPRRDPPPHWCAVSRVLASWRPWTYPSAGPSVRAAPAGNPRLLEIVAAEPSWPRPTPLNPASWLASCIPGPSSMSQCGFLVTRWLSSIRNCGNPHFARRTEVLQSTYGLLWPERLHSLTPNEHLDLSTYSRVSKWSRMV